VSTETSTSPIGADSTKVLVAICAATFFGVLNASAVNVVLPQIGRSFEVGPSMLGWVMSIFLLVYGVAIPFYGKLADRYGARKLFIGGVGLFGLGSMLCAIAPSLETLLAARVVQGLGGAAFPGLGMTLASRAVPPEKRGTALGYIAATMGVGAAVGPLIGGIAADFVSWRLLFGASAIALVVIPAAHASLPKEDTNPNAPLDLLGGILLAIGVAAGLYSVAEGSRVGWTLPVIVAAVAGVSAMAFLVYHQATTENPFLPRELLRSATYRRAVTMAFCATGSYLAILIGMPLFLTHFHGLSPFEIGLVLVPEALLMAVTGVIAGRVVDRIGPRVPTFAGALMLVVVAIGLSTTAGNSLVAAVILGGVLGAGYAMLNTPIAAAISTIVEPKVLASALSLNAMIFFVGGSFGTTAFVAIAEARTTAGAAWNPAHSGAATAFSDAFIVFVVPMVLTGILALTLPKRRAGDSDSPTRSNAPSKQAIQSTRPHLSGGTR